MICHLRTLILFQLLLVADPISSSVEEEKTSSTSIRNRILRHQRKFLQLLRRLQNGIQQHQETFQTISSQENWRQDCRRMAKEIEEESALEIRGAEDSCLEMQNHEPYIGMTMEVYNVESCDAATVADRSKLHGDKLMIAYELLSPVVEQLGAIPKHASDYAYTSALTWGDDFYVEEEATSGDMQVQPAAQVSVKITPTTWWQWWFVFMGTNNRSSEHDESNYEPHYAFAGGSHGEVWRGRRRCEGGDCKDDKLLILKRLKVEHGMELLEAGLREIYFGHIIGRTNLSGSLFTTYVDHFFRQVPGQTAMELWIVFEDAGASLRSYLYKPITSDGGFVLFQHSPFWRMLRMASTNRTIPVDPVDDSENASVAVGSPFPRGQRTPRKPLDSSAGRKLLREVLRQILESAAQLADHGIVHRDIKPSNVMCTTKVDLQEMFEATDPDVSQISCVLGDFSSAWDRFSNQNLYSKGPSKDEQTQEYSPPEALIGQNWIPFNADRPESYDSWSIGVLTLELLLGTPNVFSVDQRTTVLLTNRMTKHGASQEDIQRALYLAALSQFCIFVPEISSGGDSNRWPMRHGDPLHKTSMVKQSCTIQDFHQALRARDPLGIGFDSSADLLLHLIWKLLAWDPLERISPSEALRHPFFTILDLDQHSLIATTDNALDSLMLDPRMDTRGTDPVGTFTCPKCGRSFSDWQSCHVHANSRKHAKFCTYDRSQLPSCLNAHTLLPAHPFSGYCDIQGRRRTIEDFHAVQLHPDHHFYGVFDGHTGNFAAKYAASVFYGMLQSRFANISAESKYVAAWKDDVATKMNGIFEEIHENFLEAVSFAPVGVMDQSGTTATIIYMNDHVVLIASIGDSRAILSSRDHETGELTFRQLTDNHVAANDVERDLVVQRGGYVSKTPSGVDRVNGQLVITRSIGDSDISKYLSREPSVVAMTRAEVVSEMCGLERCFMVLASDGLWDVMSNQEVVDMVDEVLTVYEDRKDGPSWEEGGAFQEAAERLTQEAYMRGSTDNIGVCVVAMDS
jgi:serine/threonine protein phosphatase PrpC/serine/threonine protein kinase